MCMYFSLSFPWSSQKDSLFRRLNEPTSLKYVNTSMHRVSHPWVARAFDLFGFAPFIPVKQQQQPDPEFSTIKFPNPEEKGTSIYIYRASSVEQQYPGALVRMLILLDWAVGNTVVNCRILQSALPTAKARRMCLHKTLTLIALRPPKNSTSFLVSFPLC